MHLLLVEDEGPKQRHISAFLMGTFASIELAVAKSVRSALQSLELRTPELVILDMSLPTFDILPNETGGRPQGFGGLELLRNMEMLEFGCPVVVLTGYESFAKAGGQVSLDALAEELRAAYPEGFRGIFHYNSSYGDWQENLAAVLIDMGVRKR